jgi:uncharacterized membrane protein YhaH (DUF805 family)
MTTFDETTDKLDQPAYGIGPVEAVQRFFRKYAVFSGRASRSEYWWVALALFLVYLVLGAIAGVVGASTATVNAAGKSEPGVAFIVPLMILFIIGLVALVPGIAVTVRRLHDANFSGFLYFLNAIPYVGGFVVFILTLMPSNPLGRRYDEGAVTVVSPAPSQATPPPAV